MKTALFTDFLCVATSGATVDGRNIDAKDLKDMAESYNPDTYTALIWLEHYRYFGNYGRVIELKTEEQGDVTKLYAKLAPNAELLALNQQGQKIFTSIEITPNFAKTGKAYLSGLAITDSPASTGTTALMFNRIGSNNVIVGDAVEVDFNHLMSDPTDEPTLRQKFFNWLFAHGDEPVEKKLFNNVNKDTPTNKELPEMDKQEFKTALTEAVAAAVTAAFASQNAQANAQPTPPAQPENTQNHNTNPPAQSTEKPVETVSAQEFNDLKAKYDALETKFNQALQPQTQVPKGLPEASFSITEKTGF